MSIDTNDTVAKTRLSGKSLIIARLIWWVVTILTFVYDVAALLHSFERPLSSIDEILRTQIQQNGISLMFFGAYKTAIDFSVVFLFLVAGVVIFWFRSDDWVALWVSLAIVVGGLTQGGAGQALADAQPVWRIPFIMLFTFTSVIVFLSFFFFPDGRLIPHWVRWMVVPDVVFELFRAISLFVAPHLTFVLYEITSILFISGILAQVYRYRRFSNLVQRQQSKWVIYGVALMTIGSFFETLLHPIYFPLLNGLSLKFYLFVLAVIINNGFPFAPIIAIIFSILHYRLWDIDFIINRSLVYGVLTALLAALFGFSLFFVSQLFQSFTGAPLVAVAVSATIFGAIFQPTRRQVQRFVDRRFYHIEIDYQKTSLPQVTADLTEVVRQTHFGVYQDLELIGRGGMAEVYRAMHPTLNIRVAIKILPARLAGEEELRQRFTREAQVVSKLTHPNIVRMFDSGEQDSRHYIVMEYLAGKDLDRLLKENGRLPISQTLPLIQQIASALDYAHGEGFIHRDIKPSNVLLDTSSNNVRAVLTDFGIAKINNAHTAVTRTGYMLGTFDYVAPEQIQESSNVDGRADIYALGVMVYQMLTGELPFKHSNPGALLIAHLNQPAPDACEVLPDLPHHISAAIQRAMAKMPEERFATAGEFVSEISRVELPRENSNPFASALDLALEG